MELYNFPALLALLTVFITFQTCCAQLRNFKKKVYACEGASVTIKCAPGRTIQIQRANYGRFNRDACYEGEDTTEWDTNCQSIHAIHIVNEICSNRTECSVNADTILFSPDPCPDTPKYLEIEYVCSLVHDGGSDSDHTWYPRTRPPIKYTTTEAARTTVRSTTSRTTKDVDEMTTEGSKIGEIVRSSTTPATTHRPTTTPYQPPDEPGAAERTYCDQTWIRNISWPITQMGDVASEPCPNNPLTRATWRCGGQHPVQWVGFPDLSLCVSPMLADMAYRVKDAGTILTERSGTQDEHVIRVKEQMAAAIVEEVTADMVTLSQNEVYGGDVQELSNLMEQMVAQIDTKSHNISSHTTEKLVNNVNKAVVKSTSNILDKKKKEAWQDLPQKSQAETATRVVDAVEKSAFQLADTCHSPTTIVNVDINIILEIDVVDTRSVNVPDIIFPKVEHLAASSEWASQGNSIRLSGNTIREYGVEGLAKLIFATYQNLEELLQPQADQYRKPVKNGGSGGGKEPVYTSDYYAADEYSPRLTTVQAFTQGDDFDKELIYEEIKYEEEGEKVTVTPQISNVIDGDAYNYQYDNIFDIDVQTFDIQAMEEEEIEKQEEYTNEIAVDEYTDSDSEDSNVIVNTPIISASINGRKETNHLSEPVYYTLAHKSTNNIYNPTCSYWEYEERTMDGHWSSFGCKLVDTNVTHSTCACNHMTNFAVLMSVRDVVIDARHTMGLQLITYIGCIISLVCLLICFLTFTFMKNLQCDRNTIHKNLCLCLLLAQVIFVCGIMQHDKLILCSVIAGLLHYFLLCAFVWMFLEGLQLYIMLIEVFEAEKSRRLYYYLSGYGIPAIIVTVSASVYPGGYGTLKHCWLTTERGFIWAFVGPVIAVISVNIVMLSIAIYKMCEHAKSVSSWKMKEQSRLDRIRSWLKGATVLVILLGLTWSFGLLYVSDHAASLFWAYVFTVLNSLQGFFIFIFHCLLNDKVQKEYKKYARRTTWLPDCIRVTYGGAKSYTSSSNTQNHSTSGQNLLQFWSSRFRKQSSASTLVNKSTSLHPISHDDSSGLPPRINPNLLPPPPDMNASCTEATEDPGGYLEPVSLRASHAGLAPDGIDCGEYTSNIEGSCVASGYYGYGNEAAGPIEEEEDLPLKLDLDKYMIQKKGGSESSLDDVKACKLSDEDDGVCCKGMDCDEESSPFLAKKDLDDTGCQDYEEIDDLDDDDMLKLKKKYCRLSSTESEDSCLTSSLNDLNRDCDDNTNISDPNFNIRHSVKIENTDDKLHDIRGVQV